MVTRAAFVPESPAPVTTLQVLAAPPQLPNVQSVVPLSNSGLRIKLLPPPAVGVAVGATGVFVRVGVAVGGTGVGVGAPSGTNVKSWMIISTSCPFPGGVPWKSQRFR